MKTIICRLPMLALAFLAVPAVAQTSNGRESSSEKQRPRDLEEVTVTAQRREERSIDVPMSITALSGNELSEQHINNALDLSFAVPSLTVSETQPGRQQLAIRGISSQRGSSALTGIYLDEMPMTGARGGGGSAVVSADVRVLDLQRVEVLKGPQGTLFGEGATGGVIRFITNDPDLNHVGGEVSTELSQTEGGDWNEHVGGVLNLPLVDDVLGFRLAALYHSDSGWIDQPSIGKENINDSELLHVRAKALYEPTPEIQVKALIEIHRNDGGASNIVNQEPRKESIFVQGVDVNLPTDFTDNYDAFNLAATYDFGFAQLLSSTSHLEFDSETGFTQVVGQYPNTAYEIQNDGRVTSSITSQELRLTSVEGNHFNWVMGASYKDNEFVADAGDGIGAVFGRGTPGEFIISGLLAGTRPTTTSESWATFADTSYEFDNGIEVGGGVRYFHDHRESYDPATPSDGILSDNFNKVTYRAYARYAASDDVNLYVNVATGFRSGGFNSPAFVLLGAPVSYGPEEALFYEAGVKSSLLNGRIRISTALFYGEYQGMQEDTTVITPSTALQFTSNGQDAEVQGIEWDITWAATDVLTLGLAGDLTDTEITWIDPANTAPAFRVGDPINYVPEYSLSASAEYDFNWADSAPGFLRLSFDRKGKSFESGGLGAAPELSFLNASVGAEFSGWNLAVFGRNLLDEYRIMNAAQTGWTAQARPRMIGVSVSKSFSGINK